MYLEHFGLKRKPFKITPDTSLFYEGNKRGAALGALKYAIESGEGIIKVVGEVGTGKTMLCRMLEVELPDNIEIVYIANPSLSPDNILHVIGHELKLEINAGSSKLEVMHKLQDYLLKRHAENRQVVVFVEEAQSMPIETLEEIRLLSNLETNEHKLLQMVLFGQPELDEKLKNKSIRQLNERITHSFYLDPFPKSDVYEYLNFRMRAVGYRGPDIFSQSAASNIEKKSKGLTRRINIIADKALLAAYSEGGHGIKSKHINVAAEDSEFFAKKQWGRLEKAAIFVVVIALSLWAGTFIPGLLQARGEVEKSEIKKVDESIAVIVPVEAVKEQARVPVVVSEEVTPGMAVQIMDSSEANTIGGVVEVDPLIQAKEQVVAEEIDSNIDVVTERYKVTETWLNKPDRGNYTIQLILLDAGSRYKVERFVNQAVRLLERDKIYIYKSIIDDLDFYSVVYGEFNSKREALSILYEMPDELKRNDPYLRNIRDIQSELDKIASKDTVLNEENN